VPAAKKDLLACRNGTDMASLTSVALGVHSRRNRYGLTSVTLVPRYRKLLRAFIRGVFISGRRRDQRVQGIASPGALRGLLKRTDV
jgi:hypothetical protein